MTLHCRNTNHIVSYVTTAGQSFIVQYTGDVELHRPKKSPVSGDKNMILLGVCF